MKTRKNYSVLFLILATLLLNCNVVGERGNGNVVKQERKVAAFNAIDVSGAFDVYITQGSTQLVVVEADENLLPLIRTEVKGGILMVGNEKPIRDPKSLKVHITVPDLKGIEISGAVNLHSQNKLTFSELEIKISGAAGITLELAVQKLEIGSSGGSEMKLSGMANRVDMNVSGAVNLHAFDLMTEVIHLKISGAGDAEINVSRELYADISGAASVRYKGDPPKVDANASGAGSIKKAD